MYISGSSGQSAAGGEWGWCSITKHLSETSGAGLSCGLSSFALYSSGGRAAEGGDSWWSITKLLPETSVVGLSCGLSSFVLYSIGGRAARRRLNILPARLEFIQLVRPPQYCVENDSAWLAKQPFVLTSSRTIPSSAKIVRKLFFLKNHQKHTVLDRAFLVKNS